MCWTSVTIKYLSYEQNLHQSLYGQGSSILERAAKKRQHMVIASVRWNRLELGLEEEANWLSSLEKKLPKMDNVSSTDIDKYCSQHQVSPTAFSNYYFPV